MCITFLQVWRHGGLQGGGVSSDASPVRRCLIWLGACEEPVRQRLAAEGWSLREQADRQPSAIGLRGQDQVALLLDLRQASLGEREALIATARAFSHLDRLCLLPAADSETATCWEPLCRLCGHVLDAPLDPDALARCLRQLHGPHSDSHNPQPLQRLLGNSPAILATRATVHKYAPVDLPVLVTGATGTGKEVAARALHSLSQRALAPFVATNCGAIPVSLVQAELFGHERGAFTGATGRRQGLFEHAHGGTVFLDEVGDLPADAQTALLRVLQEGTLERIGSREPVRVDVRVIAATHVDLEQAVAEGRFRSDLYYRLNVLRLSMPPLQQRGDDIVLLADNALEQLRHRHAVRARGFSADAIAALLAWRWPGNVRELLNRVQRAAIVCETELISVNDLELPYAVAGQRAASGVLDDARRLAERQTLLSSLQANGWNISATARQMQVSRVTIYRLCRRHQLGLRPAGAHSA